MKRQKLHLVTLVLALATVSLSFARQEKDAGAASIDAPFHMEPIVECQFQDTDFLITDYGALADSLAVNTEAIANAIRACHEAGGGRVVVPEGVWLTGPIHLMSNVNLYLSEGSVLRFIDTPKAYLPAVLSSWEGLECYNYSPLVYALECENIAITGTGKLAPIMDTWSEWFGRPEGHLDALKRLYTMAATDVPVEERQMADEVSCLRPQLIQLNRCKGILLDGFTIRESPFWTIHLYLCNDAIVRNLDVKAHGHNNDGIDIEMSRNVLVEHCTFDQGDDAVVIKSARNHDAWRINKPSENIVVRYCDIKKGHTLLGIGSEMSAGVRNVYMHDCTAPDSIIRLFFAKTNHRRGGYIQDIWMKNVRAGKMKRVLEVDTDVLYQWRDLVPTYKDSITLISGLHMENVTAERTEAIYELKGDERLPIRDVEMRNVKVGEVTKFVKKAENAEGIVEEDVTYEVGPKS